MDSSGRLTRLALVLLPLLCHCVASMSPGAVRSSGADEPDDASVGAGRDAAPDAAASSKDTRKDTAAAVDRRPVDSKPKPDINFPKVTCAEDLLFCEDFEGGALGLLDPSRWTAMLDGSILSFDDKRAFAGKYSLHIKKTNPKGIGGYIETVRKFPIAGGSFNVRFYYWMDKVTVNRWFTIVWLGDYRGEHSYAFGMVPQSETMPAPSVFESIYLFADPNQVAKFSTSMEASERWVCYEVEYRSWTRRCYADDQEIEDIAIPLPRNAPAFEGDIKIGVTSSHEDINPHVD